MKILNLFRDISTEFLTSGWLQCNGKKFATLERPWVADIIGKGGHKGVSCVPVGEYQLLPWDSENHPKVWALSNPQLDVYRDPASVPSIKINFARTCVLIHVANYVSELRGCIAIGKTRTREGPDWILRNSRDAVNELRTVCNGAELRLVISE